MGVDVELVELFDVDNIDEEVVSFPSVTLVIPEVQSAMEAQVSARR